MEKTKKIGFALGFYYLDAVFLRDKENDKEKVEELGDKQYFLAFW